MIDWSKTITAEARAQAEAAQRRDAIRLRRDQAIGAGVTLSGLTVGTDDTTQTRIMGAAMSAMLDPDYTVAWKAADGTFATLTAPQVIAVAQAIRTHVQACFDREAEMLAAMDAGQPYDIDAGWPGQNVVRLYPDRADGAEMEKAGIGIYRLTGPDLGNLAGDHAGPGGLTARAVWVDGALSVWVSDAGGALTDIPAGRWIVIGG